jgi:fructose-1,6-bisphosphatase/inositol monophosphatase family enzyme
MSQQTGKLNQLFNTVDIIIHNCMLNATRVILEEEANLVVEQKFNDDNPDYDEVTSADTASQLAIVNTILTLMPEAGIIGEEGYNKDTNNGFTFVIDPIDGTEEFVRKGNEVSIMIACVYEGRVIASAIHNPYTNERYTLLAKDGKCYRTRKPILALNQDVGVELVFKPHPRNRALLTYDDARSPKLDNQGYLSDPKTGFFYPHFVISGSYGTNMMKMASNQIAAVITSAYYVKPWDSLPVFGILNALGYRSYQLQDNQTWKYQQLRMDLTIYKEGVLMITRPEVMVELNNKLYQDANKMGMPVTRLSVNS